MRGRLGDSKGVRQGNPALACFLESSPASLIAKRRLIERDLLGLSYHVDDRPALDAALLVRATARARAVDHVTPLRLIILPPILTLFHCTHLYMTGAMSLSPTAATSSANVPSTPASGE